MKQFIAGAAAGVLCSIAVGGAFAAASNLDLFSEAFEKVSANYITPIEPTRLVDKALHGMLSGLDPHSTYMNVEEFNKAVGYTAGTLGEVGVKLAPTQNGYPAIIASPDPSPAFAAGIRTGDVLLAIDGRP